MLAARHNFTFTLEHIAGQDNSIADSLSRMHMQRIFELAPTAQAASDKLPDIEKLLLSALYPDWYCFYWICFTPLRLTRLQYNYYYMTIYP